MKKTILILSLIFLTACATPTQTTDVPPLPSPTAPATVSEASPTPEGIPTATFPAPPASPTTVTFTTRISPADNMTQVLVPAGILHMGGFDIHAENDELPAHDITLKEFWLDQTEVTNGMYALCVQSGACRPPQKVSSNRQPEYFGNPEFQDYPVIQIAWMDAQTYCTWAGRRLPTEAEWERAARGDDMRTYPWGDEPPSEKFANYNDLIHDTSRVGSYAAGASPFGVLDMAGNVWEWVSDYYDVDYYLTSPTENPLGSSQTPRLFQRVIRGGSYQDPWVNIRLANRGYEAGPNPNATFDSPELLGSSSVKIGFRCASDP